MDLNTNIEKFIGRGIIFPLVVTQGSVLSITGPELIRSSIKIIINTAIGTRFFLGEFGSYISLLIEKQNTNLIRNTIDTYVIDPIAKWEKRVENVDSSVISIEDNILQVEVRYRILATQQEDSFIVPFINSINF